MNLNRTELIEAYIKGQLSQAEHSAFEGELAQDPLFKNEMELQKDIVHSLKEYRKAQLKQRLNSVDMGSSFSQISTLKIATSIIVAGMIGVGAYFYFAGNREETAEQSAKVEEVIIKPSITTPPDIITESNNHKEAIQPQPTNSSSEKGSTLKKSEVNTLVISPNVANNFEDRQLVLRDSGMDHSISNKLKTPSEKLSDIEIVNEDAKAKDLKYKYLNKKLYLYGDYSSAPYELLEFNLETKTLFLFHNQTYYQLNESQKMITPLIPISDPNTIKQLDLSRDKK